MVSGAILSVNNDSGFGYFLDTKGNPLFGLTFEEVSYFSDGFAAVKMDDKWGFINLQGELVIPCIYEYVGDFWAGLAPVAIDEQFGYINTKGEIVIPMKYAYAFNFKPDGEYEPMAFVVDYVDLEKLYAINTKGEIFTGFSAFAYEFCDGLVCGSNENGYGFMNTKGEYAIPYVYEDVLAFSEGKCSVMLNDKWGFINTEGEMVIPCTFDSAGCFIEGMAALYQDGKCGYINTAGEVAVPFVYKEASDFSEGLAAVKYDDNVGYGFINTKGQLIIPFKYEDVEFFSDGLAAVKYDGMWGFINAKGETVIPFVCDAVINSFYDGIAEVVYHDEKIIIDKEGRILLHGYPSCILSSKEYAAPVWY